MGQGCAGVFEPSEIIFLPWIAWNQTFSSKIKPKETLEQGKEIISLP